MQTRLRAAPPPGRRTRTRWRLGFQSRLLTLWAWETLWPKTVFLPQISQARALTGTSVSVILAQEMDVPTGRFDPRRL